jgi:hypothetical protein
MKCLSALLYFTILGGHSFVLAQVVGPRFSHKGFAEVMLNLSIVICFVAISLSFSRFGIVFSLHQAHCLLSLNPFADIRRTLTKFYAPPFLISEEADHVEINQCHLTQI